MRVMVMMKSTPESEAGVMPETELLTAMGAFNEELVKAGVILAGEGLHPSSRGVRLNFASGTPRVIDGPFAETKELLAGFWLWQVDSFDEAIEWARRIPHAPGMEQEVEIRPVFEAADFGEAMTPELKADEDRLRATLEAQSKA